MFGAGVNGAHSTPFQCTIAVPPTAQASVGEITQRSTRSSPVPVPTLAHEDPFHRKIVPAVPPAQAVPSGFPAIALRSWLVTGW
jgi:hypothetical protein